MNLPIPADWRLIATVRSNITGATYSWDYRLQYQSLGRLARDAWALARERGYLRGSLSFKLSRPTPINPEWFLGQGI